MFLSRQEKIFLTIFSPQRIKSSFAITFPVAVSLSEIIASVVISPEPMSSSKSSLINFSRCSELIELLIMDQIISVCYKKED